MEKLDFFDSNKELNRKEYDEPPRFHIINCRICKKRARAHAHIFLSCVDCIWRVKKMEKENTEWANWGPRNEF